MPWLEMLWPLGVAVFVWWFSTGVVLMLDGLPRRTFRLSLGAGVVVALAAMVCLSRTAQHATVAGAYAAFLCALLVWGWIELSFLTGWITGPSKRPMSTGARGWSRVMQAVDAIAHHELLIAVLAVAIVALTWHQPNPVGAWTFLVLWVMRTSAKLNLFLGVRNLSEEFLPEHLRYLGSYFRRRRMNLLFPFTVTAASIVAGLLVSAALADGIPEHRQVGLLLTAALLGLAILEHWFMVLPVPASWLWKWAIRHPGKSVAARAVRATTLAESGVVSPPMSSHSHAAPVSVVPVLVSRPAPVAAHRTGTRS
jgi:putative photosynthetic complex assembly protein 2